MLNQNSLMEQTELQFKVAAKQTKWERRRRISKISQKLAIWEFWEWQNFRFALYWRIPPLIIMQLSVHYARDYAEFNLDHPAPPFTPTTTLNLRLRSRGNDKWKLSPGLLYPEITSWVSVGVGTSAWRHPIDHYISIFARIRIIKQTIKIGKLLRHQIDHFRSILYSNYKTIKTFQAPERTVQVRGLQWCWTARLPRYQTHSSM